VSLLAMDLTKKEALLTKEFPGVRQDVLSLEDGMFNELARAMAIRQSQEEKQRTTARPTQDVTAYDLYLKGMNVIRGKRNAKTAQEAYDLFEQATRLDSGFALAFSGMADACIRLYDATKDAKWPQLALGAAQQAQLLNDNLAQVHNSLGEVDLQTGRTQEAISELKRALELQPNSDEAMRRLGTAYRKAGQHDLALKTYQQAVDTNPYYWNNYNLLANEYQMTGQAQRAIEVYRQVVTRNPEEARGWGNMGAAYYDLGKSAEAIQIHFTTHKNKTFPPRRSGVFTLDFTNGKIENKRAVFLYAVRFGVIKVKGAWYEFSDGSKTYKAQGEEKALAAFAQDGVFEKMKAITDKKLAESRKEA